MKQFLYAAVSFLCVSSVVAHGGSRGGGRHRSPKIRFNPNRVRPNPETVSAVDTTVTGHTADVGKFVVLVDADTPAPPKIEAILKQVSLNPDHKDVIATFNNSAFRGFVANIGDHCLDTLAEMAEISMIEETVALSAVDTIVDQGSTWGLQRLSSSSPAVGDPTDLVFKYAHEDDSYKLGAGVDVYIVDTGVDASHLAFVNRINLGFTAFSSPVDDQGHGTHVAGTAAGYVIGVAQGANIISVKVLDNKGSGTSDTALSGIQWVVDRHEQRKKEPDFVGSVVNFSWSLGKSAALEQTIKSVTEQGIHVVVAAGNANTDACNSSPSSSGGNSGSAITVGSIGINNQISSFSNTGACVDVYAPGENILSAAFGSKDLLRLLNGTSMASPHVTGLVAYHMARDSRLAASPAAMKEHIRNTALKGIVVNTNNKALAGDALLLANNGETAAIRRRSMRTSSRDMSHGYIGATKRSAFSVMPGPALQVV